MTGLYLFVAAITKTSKTKKENIPYIIITKFSSNIQIYFKLSLKIFLLLRLRLFFVL